MDAGGELHVTGVSEPFADSMNPCVCGWMLRTPETAVSGTRTRISSSDQSGPANTSTSSRPPETLGKLTVPPAVPNRSPRTTSVSTPASYETDDPKLDTEQRR